MIPKPTIPAILSDFGTKPLHWLLVLALCLLSRTLTSIHYIADPDSLRFALAAIDYDVANMQPHFPGYLVFCFLLKTLYLITGRFAYAFSLAGGLATALLLWSGYQIYTSLFGRKWVWFYLALLFLNPMMWLLANRYMPDLTGAALALTCFAVYLKARNGNRKEIVAFFVLAGLLAGVRLSYMPLVLLPGVFLLVRPGRWIGLAAGAATVLLWLLPMIFDTGLANLIEVAITHTEGHFTEWGGTVISEPSHAQRLQRTAQFIWAHGLGGYWAGRHWISAVMGGFLALAGIWFFFGKSLISDKGSLAENELASEKSLTSYNQRSSESLLLSDAALSTQKHNAQQQGLVIVASAIIYLLWIYFYQNVVHQSRHVLPLLPLILLIPAAGYAMLTAKLRLAGFALMAALLSANIWLTGVLVWQQKKPTAVYQVKERVQKNSSAGQVIISLEMINNFLALQGIEAEFVSVDRDLRRAKNALANDKNVWLIGDFQELQAETPALPAAETFYHNPYINSLWPEITLYKYEK